MCITEAPCPVLFAMAFNIGVCTGALNKDAGTKTKEEKFAAQAEVDE